MEVALTSQARGTLSTVLMPTTTASTTKSLNDGATNDVRISPAMKKSRPRTIRWVTFHSPRVVHIFLLDGPIPEFAGGLEATDRNDHDTYGAEYQRKGLSEIS